MWTVDPPDVPATEVATACSSSCSTALRSRVLAHLPDFESNDATFSSAAATSSITTLKPEDFDIDGLSRKELVGLYDHHLVPTTKPGRAVYDRIIARARLRKCVYCSYGIATTIDHFLPKQAFPGLAIAPWNLVPCCKDCNHAMGWYRATEEDEEFLHPCYCDINQQTWLIAVIQETEPPFAIFKVQPHDSWDAKLTSRVENQFSQLRLGQVYAAVASSVIMETGSSDLSMVRASSVGSASVGGKHDS